MAAFASPIANPASWTLTAPGLLTVPPGLRYTGVSLPELRAELATPGGEIRMPALGTLRSVTDAGLVVVEVQVNPFPIRHVAQAVPFGLPTFYLVLDAGSTVVPFADGDTALDGDPLATATGLSILCAGQDRVARDPALWSQQLLAAIVGRGTPDAWEPFADAVAAQTATGATAPVLVLDHKGAPLESGAIEIVSGGTTATAVLTGSDGGDLQRTVARMHSANPASMPLTSVFGGSGGAVTLRQPPGASGDFQFSRLEDGSHAAGSIEVTPARRHVSFADLRDWFAPQFAAPAEPLLDYTRGNVLTPYVNGPEYFHDLFRRLQDARVAGADGGLHLVGGWQTFPREELTKRTPEDVADLPITLEEAATLIGAAGGATRFLSPQFLQLEPASPVETAELMVFSFIVMGLLRAQNVSFVRSDAGGAVILIALFVINAIAVTWIIGEDGRPVEPNREAIDVLDPIANAESRLAPFPARVEDNPLSPPLSGFPYDQLFTLIRHFGFYHQKFAIVRAGNSRFGYCGGIDLNPNRLDDDRHLATGPYHDVHARVEGPAVRDIELSFEERWTRDGGGTPLAFEPTLPDQAVTPGSDVVQVARTYFKAADPSRALAFAPEGDKTIENTTIQAIEAASEFIYIEEQYFTPPPRYRDALLAKVTQREIRTLVIVLPAVGDQPFGEIVRTGFIGDLQAADAGAGIVRIGYPRRHYTLPDNELRASSGRLVLMRELLSSGGVDSTVVLGPRQRLPQPPFWLAIEGELMYAFDESSATNPDPEHARVFQVVRGAETRLLEGGPATPASGPRTRTHARGAAATVIDLASIYVHAKMMIVDDVFVGIGSANINRRGHCHDGEINVFSVPQRLKAARANPIAALRRRLWAEMLDLPLATAGPLLEDPLAAARLFDRSPLHGNRFTDIDAYPTHLMFDATSGDGLVLALLKLAVGGLLTLDHDKLYDAVIDPTSALETA